MINVVKIGGNVIDNPEALSSFLKDFSALVGPKILVHGGGKEATRLAEALGVKTTMIDGRRVTDKETLDIVTMTYAGLINKRIVSLLQSFGCDAIGFTGADGNMMPATKRPATPIDFGYVGDIDPYLVNTTLLHSLLKEGFTPVMCAICHDERGTLLNCNADSVAAAMAIGCSQLSTTNLTYCFEKAGVMTDLDDENSVIPLVTEESFDALVEEGTVAKGMIPKLRNALDSAAKGVASVRICKSENLLTPRGTIVRKE